MARVDIEVKAAVDDAVRGINSVDAAMDKMGGGVKKAGLSLADMKAGLDMAGMAFNLVKGAVTGVYDAIQSVIEPTVELAGQVRILARNIGSTPEEASKLISAADDMGISADKLTSALEIAIRKGVRPTIEGIGDLADEYLAIDDPIERTRFLMEKFGKSGADLAPLMERGAAGIAELGDEAERLGLVLDQDALVAARNYELAVDDMEDSVMGLKVALGQELIPVMTVYADMLKDDVQVLSLVAQGFSEGTLTGREFDEAMLMALIPTSGRLKKAIDMLAESTLDLSEKNRDMTENNVGQWGERTGLGLRAGGDGARYMSEWVGQAADAASALEAGLSGTLQNAQEDYLGIIAETRPEIDKLTEDIARMNAAHGQTFTVVSEAEHSLEEYEMAQIKAAKAALKLAEYTGDDREEFLQLKIAADRAAESVATMGSEMGMTEQFTINMTKKLMEANAELGLLEAQEMAAEIALRKTTTEFIYQQIAANLTGEAALTLANQLGLLSDADYELALRTQDLTREWDLNKNGMIDAGLEADGLAAALLRETEATVVTTTTAAGLSKELPILSEKLGLVSGVASGATKELQGMEGALKALHGKKVEIEIITKHIEVHIRRNEGDRDDPGSGGTVPAPGDF